MNATTDNIQMTNPGEDAERGSDRGINLKETYDQTDSIQLIKTESNKRSKKLMCICSILLLTLLVAGALIYVLMFQRFWETAEEVQEASNSESIDPIIDT